MNLGFDKHLAKKHFSEEYLDTVEYFREIALRIDNHPQDINKLLNHRGIVKRCYDRDGDYLSRTKEIEAFAYGDPGVLLACPGPSIAGLMLRALGSEAQKTHFFNTIEQQQAHSFLAVSEQNQSPNFCNIQTSIKKLDENYYELNGHKWMVSHGITSPIGVLLARSSLGPLGLKAVLLNTEEMLQSTNQLERKPLDVMGLKGAQFSRFELKGLKIHRNQMLGDHLNPMDRGLMGAIKVFNQIKREMAAMALGHAQACLDYVKINRNLSSELKLDIERLETEILSIRLLLYTTENKMNLDVDIENNRIFSLAKQKATMIAKKIVNSSLNAFGASAQDHPLLLKWMRDVAGYSY